MVVYAEPGEKYSPPSRERFGEQARNSEWRIPSAEMSPRRR